MDEKNIKTLRDLIQSAQISINSAKKILNSLLGEDYEDGFETSMEGLSTYTQGEDKVIEGVFTGESMLGSDGNIYPVPQNYASKSLLVQGSKLKAIIQPSGKIVYKIIGEIPFESKIGIVTKNGEKYQITTDTKTYNVLLAAVTFHHCSIGDTVSIRIPEGKDATYAVIEAIVPKK
ncbi:MAG: hypothetical protein HHAS10_06780 [Candidatus Altimarinota bacterium]